CFFFSSRRRHTRFSRDWSSDVCSSDLYADDFEEAAAYGSYLAEQANAMIENSVPVEESMVIDYAEFVLPVDNTLFNLAAMLGIRSEERRVGKECRSRGSP